ncbi:50S ribosomal protein L13 [Candidatus Peregrinibacteria bacterium]|jgi:large subunit ribosomal protein L13|nr:50S ribosomal protein L13 [Candidatus Peregrinibacteria bacterium]MBT4631652.1 50S ribosomal protein L13 [Candidatus Peregrinibacteria bacterium]MBT5516780.1 50S ribosomal protein L13 [Candidatus Peregrinibacteria bacterium]MBT5823938.1 50S ribosomal protein L13 [Candidatus Peregrinibacteria bacterium]
MKTYHPKLADVQGKRKWFIIDANNIVLGQLATKAAVILRGKSKAIWHPSIDCGDNVIVINAEKVVLTGQKELHKKYYSHSGYPGALKTTTAKEMREKHPERIVEKAIGGMIPRNKLKKIVLGKLYVYVGSEHPHSGQTPETLTIK